jgi:signal-transduction protein with cAMP-binding, CBS, and nucleotidyltransferase domain
MLLQVAMADRLAHAEAESAELPPYSWVIVGASGRAESDQEDEGDRQQSP